MLVPYHAKVLRWNPRSRALQKSIQVRNWRHWPRGRRRGRRMRGRWGGGGRRQRWFRRILRLSSVLNNRPIDGRRCHRWSGRLGLRLYLPLQRRLLLLLLPLLLELPPHRRWIVKSIDTKAAAGRCSAGYYHLQWDTAIEIIMIYA